MQNKTPVAEDSKFGTIVGMLGAILIALGFAWLIAQNWHQIPSLLKILILVLITAACFVAGIKCREHDYTKLGGTFITLGVLMYTLSIFLISQIYSTHPSLQGFTWLLFMAWVGCFIVAYLLTSSGALTIALVEFLVWVILQWVSFSEQSHNDPLFGILALYFLAIGAALYGANLIHNATNHKFSGVYRSFTVLYILLFSYILSFQLIQPVLWSGEPVTSAYILLGILITLGLVTLFIGIQRAEGLDSKELYGFLGILVLLLSVILISSLTTNVVGTCYATSCYNNRDETACTNAPAQLRCVWVNNHCSEDYCYIYDDQESCNGNDHCTWDDTRKTCRDDGSTDNINYRTQLYEQCRALSNNHNACTDNNFCDWRAGYSWRTENTPPILWFAWIWASIILVFVILAVIAYGTKHRQTNIINIGIAFFALMVITRYIGFMIDLWGYTSLALVFITGGGILLFGGWAIEKWRRKLLASVKNE